MEAAVYGKTIYPAQQNYLYLCCSPSLSLTYAFCSFSPSGPYCSVSAAPFPSAPEIYGWKGKSKGVSRWDWTVWQWSCWDVSLTKVLQRDQQAFQAQVSGFIWINTKPKIYPLSISSSTLELKIKQNTDKRELKTKFPSSGCVASNLGCSLSLDFSSATISHSPWEPQCSASGALILPQLPALPPAAASPFLGQIQQLQYVPPIDLYRQVSLCCFQHVYIS